MKYWLNKSILLIQEKMQFIQYWLLGLFISINKAITDLLQIGKLNLITTVNQTFIIMI